MSDKFSAFMTPTLTLQIQQGHAFQRTARPESKNSETKDEILDIGTFTLSDDEFNKLEEWMMESTQPTEAMIESQQLLKRLYQKNP